MRTSIDILLSKDGFAIQGRYHSTDWGVNAEIAIEAMDEYLKESLDQLYLECEHGDDEHRQWLKDKFNDFYKKVANSQ